MNACLIRLSVMIVLLPTIAWSQTTERARPETRLPISRSHGAAGGSLVSEQVREDGTRVLHGLQVRYGPQLQIREYSVVNEGRVEQLVQLFPNGNTFRSQFRQHNGDGQEVVYAAGATKVVADRVIDASGGNIGPIRTQETLAQGTVKGGRRHQGTFLVRQHAGFKFQWRKQEFRDGKLVKDEPFPLDLLELKEIPGSDAHDRWPWTLPDWPREP